MRAIIILAVLALLIFAGCKQTPAPSPSEGTVIEPVPQAEPPAPEPAPQETADLEQSVPQEDIDAIESEMGEAQGMESDLDPQQYEDAPTI